MRYRFQVERRNRSEARGLIMAMARQGNHYHGDLNTTERLERFLAQRGSALKDLIEGCRDKEDNVPFLENLIPVGGWTASAPSGGYVSWTDSEGNEVARFEGEPGTFAMATGGAFFEKSTRDFERALKGMSYVEFLSSLANGVAGIEAYVFEKTYQHNLRSPGNELVDNKKNKVSFDDKIDKWIPRIVGMKLNKGGKEWAHFQRLKQVRDTQHAHSKNPSLSITYREMCKLMNLFRSGIAGLLLELHVLFGDKVPSKIIKYAFHPDIKLVAVAEEGERV